MEILMTLIHLYGIQLFLLSILTVTNCIYFKRTLILNIIPFFFLLRVFKDTCLTTTYLFITAYKKLT